MKVLQTKDGILIDRRAWNDLPNPLRDFPPTELRDNGDRYYSHGDAPLIPLAVYGSPSTVRSACLQGIAESAQFGPDSPGSLRRWALTAYLMGDHDDLPNEYKMTFH